MRIAVVDLLFNWPPDGGARVDVKEVFSRLSGLYEIKLFVPRFDNTLPRGRIDSDVGFETEAIPFTARTFNRWGLVREIREHVGKYKPDLVFVTDGWHLKPWAAWAVRDFPTIIRFYAYEMLCLRFHGLFMRGPRTCFRSHINNLFLDYPFCNACGLKAMIRETLKGRKDNLMEYLAATAFLPTYPSVIKKILRKANGIIVYNDLLKGILDRYNPNVMIFPGATNVTMFVEQPFKTKKPIRIGMSGRVTDYNKGYEFLRHAYIKLIENGYNVELWLTGDKDPFFASIPGVHFYGWMPQNKVNEFLAEIDICVTPSIWEEPFGMVALEAMCCAKPVIVTEVGGLQSIVEHGVNGLVVSPRSADQLADAIALLIDNDDLRRKLGQNAAQIAREKYSWERLIERFYLPLIESFSKG